MTTLPICRPGPFIDYSKVTFNTNNSPDEQIFVEEPTAAKNFIDPINGACDESEHWKWRYYLKSEKYGFEYGQESVESSTNVVENYHTFSDRKATDITVSETKKIEDEDSVKFEAGWSYIAAQDLEWELTYKCKNNGANALHACSAKYQYPGLTDSDPAVTVNDPDNGEINEISRRVKVTLPKTVFPKRVTLELIANVGEDIGAGAEVEFIWRFGPVGSFVD